MEHQTPSVDLDRAALAAADEVLSREWLVTNGTGSYASGTVAGALTRRYHGLLVAALRPPLGRTLLFATVHDTVLGDGLRVPLFTSRRVDRVGLEPEGYRTIERFRLEGTTPVWIHAAGPTRIEKRIWMLPGEDVVMVRYRHVAGPGVALELEVLVDRRDHHAVRSAAGPAMSISAVEDGIEVVAEPGAVPLGVTCAGARVELRNEWYVGYLLEREAFRGLDHVDAHLHAATFTADLPAGGAVTLTASVGRPSPPPHPDLGWLRRERYERDLAAAGGWSGEPAWVRQLVLAADQFLVDRRVAGRPGRTVIAGYHWFGDWGRDTMIALPGLALVTGRAIEAATILRTLAGFVDRGMLPNRFPDDGAEPEYNTVDATLWFFEAIEAHREATGDDGLVKELYPVLEDIVRWHRSGTRYGIRVDPADGLLAAGEPGVQLTWMDARVGDRVITPRTGKPIEINALWYNALVLMSRWAPLAGTDPAPYAELAHRAAAGFDRFWNEAAGCCFDVIDGPDGDDPSIRPNQVIAAAITHTPLTNDRIAAILGVCRRELLTPLGLRTLAPTHPDYRGRYGGGVADRDGAYHQGTVWPWLIGPYVAAMLRVGASPAAARAALDGFPDHLDQFGVGTIAEIAEGDEPHLPRGAIAQAWSVAAVLSAWKATAPGEVDRG